MLPSRLPHASSTRPNSVGTASYPNRLAGRSLLCARRIGGSVQDLAHVIRWLALCFVVGAHNQLTQQACGDELDADDHEQHAQKKERSTANLLSQNKFVVGKI